MQSIIDSNRLRFLIRRQHNDFRSLERPYQKFVYKKSISFALYFSGNITYL